MAQRSTAKTAHHERGMAKIADLKGAPYNPRRISPEAMKGLRRSLDRFGIVQEVVVNRRTGHIVGGHQRVAALRESGETDAPVVWVDLSDVEEKALNVALNSQHISGEFTDDLEALLQEVLVADEVMFGELRLDELIRDVPAVVDQDSSPQLGELEYRIVIECAGEEHQNEVLQKLEAEGIKCQALIS